MRYGGIKGLLSEDRAALFPRGWPKPDRKLCVAEMRPQKRTPGKIRTWGSTQVVASLGS
jgi:hypothetical protein